MTQSTWDPAQYERFRDERSRPFFDLLALARPRPAMRVVDLGCGTGELTRRMHRDLAARETLGIDNAETMLAQSGAFAGDGLSFAREDIATFAADPANHAAFDLVFANAALQWVPDHETLLARLTGLLAAGGQLAAQVPANYDHPSHLVAAEVVAEAPFRDALVGGGPGFGRDRPVLTPEGYASLLDQLGYREQHVRLQVYGHRMRSWEDVVEWTKGTLLTDYRRRLPPELYDRFLDRYREELGRRLGRQSPYFYPFKRILFWGQRIAI